MEKGGKQIYFLVSPEEEQIMRDMVSVGIQKQNTYLKKMALDGYCIYLKLNEVK